MTICINFAPQDKEFVEHLIFKISRSWPDQCITLWKFSDWDLLIKRVKEDTDSISAILVVLSKVAVATEWCPQKLSTELLHELDEKRVALIPVLLDDCVVPDFAQGKQLADFRTDKRVGMRAIAKEVTKVGISAPISDAAMSLDWCNADDMLVVILSYTDIFPTFSCVTHLEIRANSVANEMYENSEIKKDVNAKLRVFETLHAHFKAMTDEKAFASALAEYEHQVTVNGSSSGEQYSVLVNVRLIGDVTDCEIPVDIPSLILAVYMKMCSVVGKQPI